MSESEDSTTYTQEKLLRLLADVITHKYPLTDIETILRAGGKVNGVVTKGLKPLHYAAYENYWQAAEYLIDNGADVNLGDDIGYTPLHVASKHGHHKVVELFVKHGAQVDFSVEKGDSENGSSTQSAACALSSLTVNPLNLALENNHPAVAKILLNNGANPCQQYFLGYEINLIPMENVRCLELLLQHGADPNVFSRAGVTPLMKACKQRQPEAVDVLLKNGAEPNLQCPPKFDRKRALHFAAMVGDTDIVRLLLEAGASPDRPPGYTCSPLDFAITQDKVDVCRVLLEYGADVTELNNDDCPPLMVACSTLNLKHRNSIVLLLLQYGADPNYRGPRFSYVGPSLCPLVEYLSYQDEYDIVLVKLLLEYGGRVNIRLPTRLFRIRDAHGILGQVRKLRPYEDIFQLLLEAVELVDVEAIANESSLSNRQKEVLMTLGRAPLSLKHWSRITIRAQLHLPKPLMLESLHLPSYFYNYLLFNTP